MRFGCGCAAGARGQRVERKHPSKNYVHGPVSIRMGVMGVMVALRVTKLLWKLNFPDCHVHMVHISHIAEPESAESGSESAFDDKQVCSHQPNRNGMTVNNL